MPRTTKRYHTFDRRKRDMLEALYNARVPVKQIALELGFTHQAIYHELKRGMYMHRNYRDWTETKKYSADKAQFNAELNNTAKGAPLKLGNDREFATFVEDMILSGYSPDAILLYIKENGLKFKTKVCRVTLYSYIEKGVFLRISNKNLVRKGKKKNEKQEKQPKKLPDLERIIEKRPSEVNARSSFGHWEGDSVIGKNTKGETMLTFTERLTRMEIIMRCPDKSASSTVRMLNRLERRLGSKNFAQIFRTITFDNGTEFSDAKGIEISPYTKKRRTRVYYCHPYCSSERGSNENQNGFIRRFVPKGTPISNFTDEYLSNVQNFINDYPRKLFNGKSATKMFSIELEKLHISDILPKLRKIP